MLSVQPSTPGNVPSSASIDMPPVSVYAVLLQHDPSTGLNLGADQPPDGLVDGLTVRKGNYLKATADVGTFEHILTTDLLNHLVFVQKVFMKVTRFYCLCAELDYLELLHFCQAFVSFDIQYC